MLSAEQYLEIAKDIKENMNKVLTDSDFCEEIRYVCEMLKSEQKERK